MNIYQKADSMMRSVFLSGALVALMGGLTGCTVTEPLATEHFQEELKDPHVSIVVFRFKASQTSHAKNIFGATNRSSIDCMFAVANASTGWNFRRLDPFSMVFRTSDETIEPDSSSSVSCWVTILVPPGPSYIAVTNSQPRSGTLMMDFIDVPRFVVQVDQPQSLIYAGSIVQCDMDEKLPTCPNGLTVIDESETAKKFISRYQKGFTITSPMRTQLLTIPQTRTIEIRSDTAGGK